MKPDTRPTCASCGDRTEGFRCADCRPDRIYCRMCVRGNVPRVEANGKENYVWLCLGCHHVHEACKLCKSLTTHHTPNGVCPRCMRVVYMEAEALAREFEDWRDLMALDEYVPIVRPALAAFRDWLMRQRAAAMPADVLKLKAEPDGFDGKEFYKQQWIKCQTLLASIETALNEMTGQETDIFTNIAYLNERKSEIHAAVQAAPDAMADSKEKV